MSEENQISPIPLWSILASLVSLAFLAAPQDLLANPDPARARPDPWTSCWRAHLEEIPIGSRIRLVLKDAASASGKVASIESDAESITLIGSHHETAHSYPMASVQALCKDTRWGRQPRGMVRGTVAGIMVGGLVGSLRYKDGGYETPSSPTIGGMLIGAPIGLVFGLVMPALFRDEVCLECE